MAWIRRIDRARDEGAKELRSLPLADTLALVGRVVTLVASLQGPISFVQSRVRSYVLAALEQRCAENPEPDPGRLAGELEALAASLR